MTSSWDDAAHWYNEAVGEKGHYYHQNVVIPNALKLLQLKNGESLIDFGCGQGVFARALPKGVHYLGIDLSKKLASVAKKLTKNEAEFIVADATCDLPIKDKEFDVATFFLSLQNMTHPEKAISNAAKHLKNEGRILLILNHPCFRIPRQSGWGIDEKTKIQYRKMNRYMSPMEIPIQVHPGKNTEEKTFSYHHPLSYFISALHDSSFYVTHLQEWCSDKTSTGAKSKMENFARKEFPLFLAIQATLFKKDKVK